MDLIYTAQSKRHFYCRDAICQFVLQEGKVPLNPFRVFDYFLGDRVERDTVRRANFAMQARVDEVWVFGLELADGVLAEIAFAHQRGQRVRYFTVAAQPDEIREVSSAQVTFEAELLTLGLSQSDLRRVVAGEQEFVRPSVATAV